MADQEDRSESIPPWISVDKSERSNKTKQGASDHISDVSSKKSVAEQKSLSVMTTNTITKGTDQYSTATDISDGTMVEPPVPGENNSTIAAERFSTPEIEMTDDEMESLTDKPGQILSSSSDVSEKTETESDSSPHVPNTTKLDQKPVTRGKPNYAEILVHSLSAPIKPENDVSTVDTAESLPTVKPTDVCKMEGESSSGTSDLGEVCTPLHSESSTQSTTEKDVSETKPPDVMKGVSIPDNYTRAVTKGTPTLVTEDACTRSTSASTMPESREEESVASQDTPVPLPKDSGDPGVPSSQTHTPSGKTQPRGPPALQRHISGIEVPHKTASEKHPAGDSEANAQLPTGNEEQFEAVTGKPKQISSIEAATGKELVKEAYSTTPSAPGSTKSNQKPATGMQSDAMSFAENSEQNPNTIASSPHSKMSKTESSNFNIVISVNSSKTKTTGGHEIGEESSKETVSYAKNSDVIKDTSRLADCSATITQASTTDMNPTTGSTSAEAKPQTKIDASVVQQVKKSLTFAEHVENLASECKRHQAVVILHAFINPDTWGKELSALRNTVEVRSEIGKWKTNDAIATQCIVLEGEENVIQVNSALVVNESHFQSGIPFKYYLSCVREAKHAYEFLEVRDGRNYNRVIARKNTYRKKDKIYHHYGDYILPRPPSQSFFDQLKAAGKSIVNLLARRQDRSLAQSLRSHSLELYLKKFGHLFLKTESVDVLKLFDHCPEILAIYRQLSIQLVSDKDYGWQREKHDAGLAQDLQGWIRSMSLELLADRKTLEAHTVTMCIMEYQIAIGLFLLIVADHAQILDNCLEVADLLNACTLPPATLSSAVNILMNTLSGKSGSLNSVPTLLQKLIVMQAKKATVNVGNIIILSMWKECLDFSKLFKASDQKIIKKAAVTPVSKKIDPSWITDYLDWCNNDVESHYPGFGRVVLQIAPFVTWPKLVHTNPLDTMIVMLDERFGEDVFVDETEFETSMPVLSFQLCQILELSDWQQKMEEKQLLKLKSAASSIARKVLNLPDRYMWSLKVEAIKLCLNVYGCMPDKAVCEDVAELANFVGARIRILVMNFTWSVKAHSSEYFGCSCQEGYKKEIDLWTTVFNLPHKRLTTVRHMWTESCKSKVSHRFHKLQFSDQLEVLDALSTVQEASSTELGKMMMDKAIERFHSLPRGTQEYYIKLHSGSTGGSFQNIMVAFLHQECPNPNKVDLAHLCTWNLWSCYFKVFSSRNHADLPQSMEAYNAARDVLHITVSRIAEESLTKEELQLIVSDSEAPKRFEEIMKECYNINETDFAAEVFTKFHRMREEMNYFNESYHLILKTVQCCKPYLNAKGKDEASRLEQSQLITRSVPVVELLPHLKKQCPDGLFDLLRKQSGICDQVFGNYSCTLVKNLWVEMCEHGDLTTLMTITFPTFLTQLNREAESWISLSISCEKAVSSLPPQAEQKELQGMIDVLKACNFTVEETPNWMPMVIHKVKLFRDIRNQLTAAELLLKAKTSLGLDGDFTALKSVVQLASRCNDSLGVLTDQVQPALDFLHQSEHTLDILLAVADKLSESIELITWLKEEVKSVGELRIFANIALMAHWQDASSKDCLSSLDKAVMKLAPFIFQLPSTSGLNELIECCEVVQLETLEGIDTLLDTCNKSLDRYKEIQKMMGSMEKAVFGQVKDLAQSGIFTLKSCEDHVPKNIHELVEVKIVNPDTTKKQYSLDELKDLQSKLALIRGTITEDDISSMAELFWIGLEFTVRGADTLLELLLVGHTHYRVFNFRYSLGKPLGVHSFAQLKEQVEKMEYDLDEWKSRIEQSRGKFYELNYFTARQLSLICQVLSSQSHKGVSDSFPENWFTNLLQSISPVIRKEFVSAIVQDIIRKKEGEDYLILGLPTSSPERFDSLSGSDIGVKDTMSPLSPITQVDELNESERRILDELRIEEFSDELILKGLSIRGSDFSAVHDYCIENSYQDVHSEPLQNGIPRSSRRASDSGGNPVIDRIHEEGFSVELAVEAYKLYGEDIDAALEYCLKNEAKDLVSPRMIEPQNMTGSNLSTQISTSSYAMMMYSVPATEDVPETSIWTLDDVGFFLHQVAIKHAEEVESYFCESRFFATTCFGIGSPNLILVPRKNIFRAILGVYMYSKELPLPTAEEVLYCHTGTTAEDIRLLWRRAVGDPEKKRIFCLVCEHNLSYKVAKEAVQDLRELIQAHKDFKLVVICCEEDEGSSLLIGDLREYKRGTPPLPKKERIVDYLQTHFVMRSEEGCESAGAKVDPNGSYLRVVTSGRAGMGKSLYIRRLLEVFQESSEDIGDPLRVITLHGPDINNDAIVKVLCSVKDSGTSSLMYHLDISERVIEDIGAPLFNMFILCAMQDSEGNVWRCHKKNFYAIEITIFLNTDSNQHNADNCSVDFLQLLPTAICLSPKECIGNRQTKQSETLIPMDEALRISSPYQRAFQYLCRYSSKQSVNDFTFSDDRSEGTYREWIEVMIRSFNMPDPTWLELGHFVAFLNTQLKACEKSIYTNPLYVDDANTNVVGFKNFVAMFMIKMSVDFTVPSLQSEFGKQQHGREAKNDDLKGYEIVQRRAWEENVHPYIFFNRDTNQKHIEYDETEEQNMKQNREEIQEESYDSMTFVGFNLQQEGRTVHLVDLDHKIITENAMTDGLCRWLRDSGVKVRQDPKTWTKLDILKILSRILENKLKFNPDENDFYFTAIDPDTSYALTYDNLVKMLAIQMRFRCGIPVVIMGETGCGKTRLIRYMCELQSQLAMDPGRLNATSPGQTFFIMKVHGGITEDDIVTFVKTVQRDARVNQKNGFSTVVFFDEANTTDAIGLIKEIMCDKRMRGQPITEDIKFIAACNPYRKHSDEMIRRLESAGLGFFIKIHETKQKLGSTPLRHLVYRVLELPASMKPLVYDYGGLNADTEEVYIRRIVDNHVMNNDALKDIAGLSEAITSILSWCQKHMRDRKDECSYVSLRDIERCLIVFEWFHQMHDVFRNELGLKLDCLGPDPQEGFSIPCTMAMILSLAVCYYTRLIDRKKFEDGIVKSFKPPLVLVYRTKTFVDTIYWCQEAFLSNMELGQNIAHNQALRENVFMMTICVELRIPLFVVGKPGSSKSLAKSVVAESMKGQTSKSQLLKKLKSVRLLSYQCSQLSTPKSIIDVFDSAKTFQKDMDCTRDVAVVVLDEVGLAEDSPSLPLKALHPLLEDGTDGSDPRKNQVVKREERVAFIGISNWALDPAKMNRGIMVRRGDPDVDELVNSARGICSNNEANPVRQFLEPMLKDLAICYLTIIQKQVGQRKEFFGLRDFYSLIKMLYWLVETGGTPYRLTTGQFKHAVLRNFGGTDDFNPANSFQTCFDNHVSDSEPDDPPCEPLHLIRESLKSKEKTWHGENRYLLFLTENDAALEIMQDYLVETLPKPPYVLFGSSFPKDKDYTQVCRNINQIKICMETGRTVVLLNLENLYESLYDLLNQYYTKSMNKRYVDLGLQTHRIKCRVHDDFKLILIAEKDKVYDKFPIPLINRLEKHLVTSSTIMSEEQREIFDILVEWIGKMTHVPDTNFHEKDVFVGYQSETPVAVVLQACKVVQVPVLDDWREEVLCACKEIMIKMACPDALARLKETELRDEAVDIWNIYFQKQEHLCLSKLLTESRIKKLQKFCPPNPSMQQPMTGIDSRQEADKASVGLLVQVTTHSQPLAPVDVSRLCRELEIPKKSLIYMYLEELDAETDFTDRIRRHLVTVTEGDTYILVQCSSGHLNKDLISCARHKAVDLLENFKKEDHWKEKYMLNNRLIHIIFIISLPKTPGGSRFIAFQGGEWMCVHLDDLRSPEENALNFHVAIGTKLSELFYPGSEGIALHQRLEKCMAAAVAQIPDSSDNRGSKEDILNTLRRVVDCNKHIGSKTTTFYSILVQKILRLIEQNENTQVEVTKKDWAVREAMDPHRLQEGGTFLNTLLKRIDNTLTKLLAYIVEFVDQRNNLRLCLDENLRILWLKVFENEHLCQFSYDAIVERDDITPVVQKLGSISVGEYECHLPFSWIFLHAMEAHMKTVVLDRSKIDMLVNTLCEQVKATPVGALLHSINDDSEAVRLCGLYLKDFVAGVMQPNEQETQVLEQFIQMQSDKLLHLKETKPLLLQLLSYHIVYHLNQLQFIHYRELGRIFPSLHQALLRTVDLNEAEALDLIAVRLLLSSITPQPATNKDFWKLHNLRHKYIKNLRECQSTVDEVLRSAPVGTDCNQLKCAWQRIRAVQMYIEHLVLPLPENNEVYKGAFRLWSMLNRLSTNFSDKKCLDNFKAIVKSVDNSVAKLLCIEDMHVRRDATSNPADRDVESPEALYARYCRAVKMLFLEVISVLCFGTGSYEPPQPDLVGGLMEIVFNQQEHRTQDLTPFEWEANDKDPVIRSVLLQLILMRDWEGLDVGRLIERFMKTSIAILPGNDNSSVCALVVRCLEDKVHSNWIHLQEHRHGFAWQPEQLRLQIESSLRAFLDHTVDSSPSFRWLQSIAQLRFCLSSVADILNDYVTESPGRHQLNKREQVLLTQLLEFLFEVIQRDELGDLALYLSKQIARKYGINTLRTMYNQGHHYVLPQYLHLDDSTQRVPDLYIMCGKTYCDIRQSLVQSALDRSVQAFCKSIQDVLPDEAYCIPLAIFSKITWPVSGKIAFNEEMVQEAVASCSRLGTLNNELTTLCHSLLGRNLGGRSRVMQPSTDVGRRSLVSLVLHTTAVILQNSTNPLLRPFVNVLNAERGLNAMYLPTMPEDFLVEAMTLMDMEGEYKARGNMRGRFFACPNGHPYIITECTGPNQGMPCPICRAGIGAQVSQLAEGNYPLERMNRTETGYTLGDAKSRSRVGVPERNLSSLICAITRYILHACFLWSSCHCSEESVARIRGAITVQVQDLAVFFWEHLKLDLIVIGKTMSRGEDEVTLLLCEIINNISKVHNAAVDGSMATKDSRKQWENAFSRSIVEPVLNNANFHISAGVNEISQDAEMAQDEVFLAVNEITQVEATLTQTLLTYRPKINVHDLTTALVSTPNAQQQYPLLYRFLMDEPLLRALQYLPDVVRLQRVLTSCFSHRVDCDEASKLSIAGALKKIADSTEDHSSLVHCLEQMRKAWKIVRERLPHHRTSVPDDEVKFLADIADVLPVAYLLPSTSGPGLCSLALSDFLLFQQNDLLEFCRNSQKYSWFVKKAIPLTQTLPFHMISYEGEIDTVILTHCRYSLMFGKGQQVDYDFGALEKHIYDRFLVGKPGIDGTSQPVMVYSGDVIQQDVFEQLKKNIKPQVPLTPEDQKDVLRRLHGDLREISEALHTLTVAISFLASKGGKPEMLLSRYIINVLRIRKTEFCKKYTLSHILSLWETLALEKAKQQSSARKEIPFDGFDESSKAMFVNLDPNCAIEFGGHLRMLPLDSLMMLLFKFIQLRLKSLGSSAFEWPLAEALDAYTDAVDDNNIKDLQGSLDQIPEDILVKNVVHVWHITVQYKMKI